MNDTDYAEFLQDAALAVTDLWAKHTGENMGAMEMRALTDTIKDFFDDKRSGQ